MKNLRRDVPIYVAILLTVLVAAAAKAGTATVQWAAPTTCAQPPGAPITSCAITGYRVYGALQGQTKALVGTFLASDSIATFNNLAVGTWCYEVTALTGAAESGHSAESCKSVAAPPPVSNPPTIVTITTTAYNIVKGTNKLTLVAVGTVPLQTACDATQYVNGYNVVPRAKVTWTGTAKPIVVVAKCG